MASSAAPFPDVATMSFEDALKELEGIVRLMEEGRGKLDEAITHYERGTALRRHCEAKLNEAQAKVEQITLTAEGQPQTQTMAAP